MMVSSTYSNFFLYLETTGGTSEPTYRTADADPKQLACQYIRAHADKTTAVGIDSGQCLPIRSGEMAKLSQTRSAVGKLTLAESTGIAGSPSLIAPVDSKARRSISPVVVVAGDWNTYQSVRYFCFKDNFVVLKLSDETTMGMKKTIAFACSQGRLWYVGFSDRTASPSATEWLSGQVANEVSFSTTTFKDRDGNSCIALSSVTER